MPPTNSPSHCWTHSHWPTGKQSAAVTAASPPADGSLGLAAAADLANALLTTAAETRRLAWTLREASTSYGLVRRPAMDWLGLLNPAEKRKVGGSTPPLTTLTSANVGDAR